MKPLIMQSSPTFHQILSNNNNNNNNNNNTLFVYLEFARCNIEVLHREHVTTRSYKFRTQFVSKLILSAHKTYRP